MTKEQDSNWQDDRLGRQTQSNDIVNYLVGRSEGRRDAGLAKGFVLAIDSDYGQGKSYFVRNTMADVRAKHPACLIDAWTDDRINSPFLALLDGIETALEPFFAKDKKLKETTAKLITGSGKLVKGLAVGAGKQLAIKAVGEGAEFLLSEALEDDTDSADINSSSEAAISDAIKRVENLEDSTSKKGLREYRQQKLSMSKLRNRLHILAERIAQGNEKSLPIFVFIDELDRCRPDYAISLLEEVKHLFDVPGFVFVLSMQKAQLLKSISSVYGDEFESAEYLDRFIDKFYVLDAPSCENFIELELVKEPISADAFLPDPLNLDIATRIALVLDQEGLTLREAERAIDTLRASIALLNKTQVDAMFLVRCIVREMKIGKRTPRNKFQSFQIEWRRNNGNFHTVIEQGKISRYDDLINQLSQCARWNHSAVIEQAVNTNSPELYYGMEVMNSFYGQFEFQQPNTVTMASVCTDALVKAKPFYIEA